MFLACLLGSALLVGDALAQGENATQASPFGGSAALPSSQQLCRGASDSKSAGVDVFETVIDAPLSRLYWGNGNDSKLVFVVTKAQTVYRSVDDGVTWTGLSINSTLGAGTTARVSTIVAVEGDSSRFYFLGADGHALWTTLDSGDSFVYTSEFHASRPWVAQILPHNGIPAVAAAVGWIDLHANLYLTGEQSTRCRRERIDLKEFSIFSQSILASLGNKSRATSSPTGVCLCVRASATQTVSTALSLRAR